MNEVFEIGVGALLACLMLAIAVVDWRSYRVPDRLTLLALGLRVVEIFVNPQDSRGAAALEALWRGVTMALLFLAFRWIYGRLRGREGIGLGDVKLAGVAGAWVDWRGLPLVVEAAALFGLTLALYRTLRAGVRPRGDLKLPFAVGFAPAIFVGWWLQRIGF